MSKARQKQKSRQASGKVAATTRVNATLVEWAEIYDRDLCKNHRKEVIDQEFGLFKKLISMAPADRELELAMEHYKNHRIDGNLPYTGCAGAVLELARK